MKKGLSDREEMLLVRNKEVWVYCFIAFSFYLSRGVVMFFLGYFPLPWIYIYIYITLNK